MPARLTLRGQEYAVRSGMTIRAALLQVKINPDTVLPTRDGELLTDDELLREDDRIKLVAVISGGSLPASD
jgi:sulfur carrier protein ThiS